MIPRVIPRALRLLLSDAGVSVRRGETLSLPLDRWATARMRLKPDFVVIGAQRAGTTALYRCLWQHPFVLKALHKEIHFFDNNYFRGDLWYRGHFALASERQAFERKRGHPFATGEASPYYLFHPLAAQRGGRTIPHAKVVAILRNPTDRAFSHFQMQVRKGREPLSFEDAVAAEEGRLAGEEERLRHDPRYYSNNHQRHSYLARGRYAEQVERWFGAFPRQQVLVIQAEEFFEDQFGVFRRLVEFLELPPWEPEAMPPNRAQPYSPMDPATRARLVEYFRPHNARLNALLGTAFDWDA